ncbi:MAG: hypothetical protein K6C34_02380 [Alphaproteobacteria bacterium]|nr:hypothetical protein [Alphaproteobacteria bacterium]
MSADYWSVKGIGVNEEDLANEVSGPKVVAALKKLKEAGVFKRAAADVQKSLKALNNTYGEDMDSDDIYDMLDSLGIYTLVELLSDILETSTGTCLFNYLETGYQEGYLFYPAKYQWDMQAKDPVTRGQVEDILAEAIVKITDLSQDEAKTLIKDIDEAGEY